jgi:hypothetical protein
MMRKASTCLALLGLGVLGLLASLPAAASAAPVVTLKAVPVPVPVNPAKANGPNYPGTGDILGAPAALEGEFNISGTEYGGFPPPLREVKIFLPKGVQINTKGFATCAATTLEHEGPEKCPAKSYASPVGEARGVVSFGGERVHENVTVQGFFAPGGGLSFYVEGKTPVSLVLLSKAAISSSPGGGFGQLFSAEVPLIETVPGALDGSAEFIKAKVGAAYKKGKKLISYGTLPKTCPKGGFPIKAELKFGVGAPSEWVASTAAYTSPCPKHKK